MGVVRSTDRHRRDLRGFYSDIGGWAERGLTKRTIADTVRELLDELDLAWSAFDGMCDVLMNLLALDAQAPPQTEDAELRRKTARGLLTTELARRLREPATSLNGRTTPKPDTDMPPCTADAGGE
jgi:hypothetical protein